jgi:hypothetical protein
MEPMRKAVAKLSHEVERRREVLIYESQAMRGLDASAERTQRPVALQKIVPAGDWAKARTKRLQQELIQSDCREDHGCAV